MTSSRLASTALPRHARDLSVALEELLDGREVSIAKTEPVGCRISRVRRPGKGEVTYSNQVARILRDRCVVCHRPGDIAPFALTSYKEAAGWAETIVEVVRDGRMPPWHASPEYGKFANDAHLTDDEKNRITAWVADGAPEGDSRELPEPPKFDDRSGASPSPTSSSSCRRPSKCPRKVSCPIRIS